MHKRLCVVTGNIGAGKSTTMTLLKHKYEFNPNIVFVQEPVDEWQFWLRRFYKERNEVNSIKFQMEVFSYFHDVVKLYEKAPDGTLFVMERSIHDALGVFIETNKSDYSKENYDMMVTLHKLYENGPPYSTAKFVYIRCPPAVALSRISKRSRDGESEIDLEYMKRLHEAYDNLYMKSDLRERTKCVEVTESDDEDAVVKAVESALFQ
jgi:deoxyadenosine/deoxycytidine kinase